MSDILQFEPRVTRKEHHCWGCGKKYPPKSNLTHASYADGGSVSSCYWCNTCLEYMHRYMEYGDEVGYREIYENDAETWEKLNTELNGQKTEESEGSK